MVPGVDRQSSMKCVAGPRQILRQMMNSGSWFHELFRQVSVGSFPTLVLRAIMFSFVSVSC